MPTARPTFAALALTVLGVTTLASAAGTTAKHRASSSKPPKPLPEHKHGRVRPRTKPIPLTHAPGSRAERYAALGASACLDELGRRSIGFVREPPTRGVEIPVRPTGKVGGVLYRTDFPDAERSKVPWEVFDCRLLLSLDDFGEVLRQHDIVEVRMFSCWRPPPKNWPEAEWGKRHEGALAIDVRELRRENGEVLNVLEQFNGRVGATLCGPNATPPNPNTEAARELHELACAAVDSHLFNSVLTPNYNAPHKNHFHLELTPNVDWFIAH